MTGAARLKGRISISSQEKYPGSQREAPAAGTSDSKYSRTFLIRTIHWNSFGVFFSLCPQKFSIFNNQKILIKITGGLAGADFDRLLTSGDLRSIRVNN